VMNFSIVAAIDITRYHYGLPSFALTVPQ
jgi:hypothetical protein